MASEKLISDFIEEISMGPFGSDITVDNYVSNGVPVLNGSNVSGFKLTEESFNYVSEDKAKSFRKAIARRGDVVITHRGTLGQIAYIPEDSKFEKYVISQSQFRVRFNHAIDPRYLVYLFHTDYGQKKLLSFKNHVGVPALAQATTNFRNLKIAIHEFGEQKSIADFISNLQRKIELNNRINAELEAMAKTIYDYWFVQFDFPDKDGKPYKSSGGKMIWNEELKREIPDGWACKTLGDVVTSTGTGLNPRDNFVLGEGENYYVTIKNIEQGRVILDNRCDRISDKSLEIINRRSDLQVGDILFTSIEPVGITYLILERPQNWNINESVFTIRPNYDILTSEYLYMFLSGDYIKNYTKNVAAGSIHKGVRHGVLKGCKFILSNKKLIDDFTNLINPILKRIDLVQKENQQLSFLRDWLLPMLMNGQVKVN